MEILLFLLFRSLEVEIPTAEGDRILEAVAKLLVNHDDHVCTGGVKILDGYLRAHTAGCSDCRLGRCTHVDSIDRLLLANPNIRIRHKGKLMVSGRSKRVLSPFFCRPLSRNT